MFIAAYHCVTIIITQRQDLMKKIKCYRLPRDLHLHQKYKTDLKTDGINFKNKHICCESWIRGTEIVQIFQTSQYQLLKSQ